MEQRVMMSASLLKNINTTLADASPSELTVSGGSLYFDATDGVHGLQLWKTDGTAAGTVQLNDLIPGYSSWGTDLTDVNGTLYFLDTLGSTGRGGDIFNSLWRTDGKPAGTSEIGEADGANTLTNVNGTLYYFASTADNRSAPSGLYETDGTPAGTHFLDATGMSTSATAYNGELYFTIGQTLWKSDGTSAGTVSVETFSGTFSAEVLTSSGKLFVEDGQSLWVSNGTAAGTSLVQTIGGTIQGSASFQGDLFFAVLNSNQQMGIWKTDGTPSGTSLVAAVPSAPTVTSFAVLNNALYFETEDPSTQNKVLWRTDGTTQGTVNVNNILGPASLESWTQLTTYNGDIYFAASDVVHGAELWATDGTAAGTHQVTQINNIQNGAITAGTSSIAINGETYFDATDGTTDGLWKTDGTGFGTALVSYMSGPISDMINANGTLFFSAGGELWKSDGTTGGTVAITPGTAAAASAPFDITPVGSNIYFFGYGGTNRLITLYRSDGTSKGTTQIAVAVPNYYGNSENDIGMADFNGTLFYTMLGTSNNIKLWDINPTTGAPAVVASFGGTNQFPPELTVAGGYLFFVADDGLHGPAIWRTNSSLNTTMIYSPVTEGQYFNFSPHLFAFDDVLYFSDFVGDTGLNKLDPATSQVSYLGTYDALDFVPSGSQLYFQTGGSLYGTLLGVTDGTVAGTHVVDSALSIPSGAGIVPMLADGGLLYFIAVNNSDITQLWQTDGTNTSIADPSETVAGWTPTTLLGTASQGLIFAASEIPDSNEPWVFTGTASSSASFVDADSATGGNWTGAYGSDGYSVVGGDTSLPSYASMEVSDASFWQWAGPSTIQRAPQVSAGSSSHVAASDYSATSFTVDLNFAPGASHLVAFYLLDFDLLGRTETVQVSNGDTGQVLDTRTVSNFQFGQYLVYDLSGDVKITFMNAPGSHNAVLSAILFGTPSSASFAGTDSSTQGHWTGVYGSQGYDVYDGATDLPNTVDYATNVQQFYQWASSTTDPRDLQLSAGSSNLIAACAYSDNPSFTITLHFLDSQQHQVSFYLLDYDAQNRAETIQISNAVTGAVLDTETFKNFTQGVYARWDLGGDVNITFSNAGGLNEVVSGLFIDPLPRPSASAMFVKTDTTTQGTYTGVYGSGGYYVAGSSSEVQPTYATLDIPRNLQEYTWASNTTAINALQDSPGSSARVAGCIYSDFPSFNFNINITDGQTHQVALYLLDYDSQHRSETITITNYATNQVLDTETVSNFTGGKYLVWNLSGDVNITITNSGGLNEVLSGVFFG
jgi:ELWxxDGT repeat protein